MRTTFKSLACPFTLILMSFGFAPSAMADHDHGRGHGHGHGHGHKHRAHEHKEEFWDGNCKIERKWEKDGDYKEKRTCKDVAVRQAQPVAIQPVTVIYPPWVVVEQGRPHRYKSGYEPVPVQPVQQAQVSYCNSETVGKVLGGVAGALLGNQVGKGSGRAVATVGGAIAGVLVGGEVGRQMDARDQACIGQALELAPAGRRVEWVDGGGKYAVVPGAVVTRGDTYCRPYQAQVHTGTGWQTTKGTACRRNDGVWVTTT